MSIRIVPYTAEHEEAVRAFNARIAAVPMDRSRFSTRFPESHVPDWLPPRPNCEIYQEYFVAVDGQSAVRGGYILKHQPFVLHGERLELTDYQLPISEGLIDRQYASVAVSVYMDALRRRPDSLWGLGGGGRNGANPRFLLHANWQMAIVPFWFRVVRPNAFLQNIAFLRTSSVRRGLLDALRHTGAGWLGVKTLQTLQSTRRPGTNVTCETVAEFSDWVDDIWRRSASDYSLIAVRDRPILDALYPAKAFRFIRLKIKRGGHVIGWAVLLNTPMSEHRHFGNMQVGTIVDCLARSEDAGDVVACARDVLESDGVDLIVSNQSNRAWCRALREGGFMEGPSNLPFLASPKLAARLQPLEENVAAFHFNRGDGDGPIHL
ncbi:MAG: hypothetical protein LLF97_08305 [Planctomycetaceae bacterium]|nr:hypothetical protein [Planctomycetaceae bacterium]